MDGFEKVTTSYTADIDRLRDTFATGKTKNLKWRIEQLKQLRKFMQDKFDDFVKAMDKDIRKPRMECITMECDFVLNDIQSTLNDIEDWVKPESCAKSLMTIMDSTYVHSEPFGVALIFGAWNYPVQLLASPLIGAIAAGNCAVLKPSELSPATAKVFEGLTDYLDKDAYFLVNGGVPEATELLKERYDYIFYTGSIGVGKIIYAAAQKYLTPVTLELGGKSPVYLDHRVDILVATRRLLWGKYTNTGQTCVAPDYVMVPDSIYDQFIDTARRVIKEFFGDDVKNSPDFGRIVTSRHVERLQKLLSGSEVAVGGEVDVADRFISPTIVRATLNDPIMQEEIFGPILPVIKVSGFDEAVSIINSRDKPLAAYLFTEDKAMIKAFLNRTSSGSVCINDCLVHLSVDSLPFGGVGTSGMGRYHGKHSFDAFSNKKAVLQRDFNFIGELVGGKRYPPSNDADISFFRMILKRRAKFPLGFLCKYFCPLLCMLIGAAIATLAIHYTD